ncbi:MAG: hypothetical protein IPG91_01490 [Ideonella sp.]|nr:hypothetical protein [Ideonella sp.]
MTFGLQKADASWVYFGIHYIGYSTGQNGTPPTIDALQTALAGGPLQLQYGFSSSSTSIESLTWKGVETVNAKGGIHEDSLVYINGTEYAGNGGVDTFYADWSSWTEAVTWTNAKNAGNSRSSATRPSPPSAPPIRSRSRAWSACCSSPAAATTPSCRTSPAPTTSSGSAAATTA